MSDTRDYRIFVYGLGTIAQGIPGTDADDALRRYIGMFGDEAPTHVGFNEARISCGPHMDKKMIAVTP
jgi:hypothetical protein